MSYCRWSCDDFQCDLYVFEHCDGGFVTHVAKRRYVYAEPLPPLVPMDSDHVEEWIDRNRKVMAMVQEAESRPIGLPHDGEDFVDATAAECADRLEQLRAMGYRVPQHAIDALREEA